MSKLERIAEAYKMMAKLGYRPAAPSDGFGGFTVPHAELDVDTEAREYARRFVAEEDTDSYWAGCTHYEFNRAAVLALEAFRLMNAGRFWGLDHGKGPELVPRCCGRPPRSMSRRCGKNCPTRTGTSRWAVPTLPIGGSTPARIAVRFLRAVPGTPRAR